jgi:trans-aconitate 2-methyltransferase
MTSRTASDDDSAATPWNAGDYARNSSLQEAMAGEALALLRLNGDERMLDIGCGDGRLTARIAERLPRGRILGVDASKDMVDFAAAHWVAGANDRLRFAVADAAALAFHAEFDRIVSFNALHWVPAQERALDGIRAALAPGGRAQLRMVVKGPVTSLEEVAEAVRQAEDRRAHFEGFTDPYLRLDSDAYAALAEARGFRILGRSTRLHAWDFRTDEAFFGFCKAGFGAWTRRLPADRHDDFVREVIAAYRQAQAAPPAERNVFRFYELDIELG